MASNRTELDSLVITTRGDGAVFVVELQGAADQPTPDSLRSIIETVHADAVRDRLAAVVLDLTRLEFMSSSAFKVLLSWVHSIQNLPPDHRYRIRVQSNTAIAWQKRSLQSLSYFAVDLVTVEYPQSA